MTSSPNLRKNHRATCLVPVEGKRGSAYEHTITLDISQSGIGFASDREVTVNDQIAVELELSLDGDFVVKVGTVKWVKKDPHKECYRFGMQLEQEPEIPEEEASESVF